MTKMAAARVLNASAGQVIAKRETSSLENIINQCVHTKASWGLMQNDIVFALAFWSMVECGFHAVPCEETKKHQGQENLPKNWKHETRQLYEAHLFLPPYANYPVKLVALPADDILCINVLASNVSPKNISLKSLAIYSPGYVPRPEDDSTCYKFPCLSDLYLLLKNLIIWPIRCAILTDQGILNGSLSGLSDEIKLKIVGHLSLREILRLSQTCHDLNRICNDQGLWKRIFESHFRRLSQCLPEVEEEGRGQDVDWKERFKEAYTQKLGERSVGDSPTESYYTSPENAYGSSIDFEID